LDNDGLGDVCDPDDDNDGIDDGVDNCPVTPNSGQEDNDNDGVGDVCDADDDNDGVDDGADNCPLTANPGQEDNDGDGIGDVCDPDDDNDGVDDGVDNCPLTANPGQEDTDGDGAGDVCDADDDNDGVDDGEDICAGTVIPEGVPTQSLKNNRYALVDNDLIFDTGGGGNPLTITTTDTGGCSCEQIIAAQGLGQGHVKFGCSKGAMLNWIDLINGGTGGGDDSDSEDSDSEDSDSDSGDSDSGDSDSSGRSRRAPSPTPDAPWTGSGIAVTIVGEGDVTSNRAEIDGRHYQGVMCSGGGSCASRFVDGAEVRLYARSHTGRSRFVEWRGDCSGSSPITVVIASESTACTAVFEAVDQD